MRDTYLEVTFRKGKPLAAYLYLSGRKDARSARSQRLEPDLIVDYDYEGHPIGLEITAPSHTPAARINQVLEQLHLSRLPDRELAPLAAA
jgi:uncharacterized protein YuzE